MTPCSSPLFFLGYFFLNSVVPMLNNCASFGVGGRASSRPWAWPRRRWFGGEVLLTVFWGLTPWTHAVKPVAKRKQSHALARPRRTTRPPCSRIAFTVAGASRPRARVRPDQDRRPPARRRQPGLHQRARARQRRHTLLRPAASLRTRSRGIAPPTPLPRRLTIGI